MPRIELSKKNFFYNLDEIKKQTKSINKIALVLKDNAYGHGLIEIAKLANEYGVKKAVVRSDKEASEVEEYFDYILVLSDIPTIVSKKIHYTINDINNIHKFPIGSLVELKVDTGMGRNGISLSELDIAYESIEKQGLKLKAIFTHHACADELDGIYEEQKKSFLQLKQKAPKGLKFHSCNSAALFREDDFDEDMARVGIAAYGCLELSHELSDVIFKPVLSLYSTKISTRTLKKGESVGYSASYRSKNEESVSNYDIGYSDGFLRVLSNSYETPDKIKIAGRISMDNSSFLCNKEELLIFKDAREVAKCAKTISYEILTSLKSYIKREVV
ncbi:alanine racemase [Sulfurimonas sp.]|jgi:alanine racemase|uniref:alanine racemase n=1 Tax=Sulfurimonas sp. TaxID=2022749 RepID=UPI0025F272EF|nr:alanine racemase [Sulfurimonas sp.]MBT5934743.1 alanine racemase [Sulfurimonas sp.]